MYFCFQVLSSALGQFQASLQSFEGNVSQLASLAAHLSSQGISSNPFSRLTIEVRCISFPLCWKHFNTMRPLCASQHFQNLNVQSSLRLQDVNEKWGRVQAL